MCLRPVYTGHEKIINIKNQHWGSHPLFVNKYVFNDVFTMFSTISLF